MQGVFFYSILFLIPIVLVLVLYVGYQFGYKRGITFTDRAWQERVPEIREDARSRSRAVLGGKFSENLAAYLPDFPFSPTECRFLGAPVDLVVFDGLDAQELQQIVFVEVKSGQSGLTKSETQIKQAVLDGRVQWYEYRVPHEITS